MNTSVKTAPDLLLKEARKADGTALGLLLESCRNYLTLLARVQIGRRLQGKVDASDVIQDVFLSAHRDFAQFAGTTEKAFAGWLRQILACRLSDMVRHYCAAQRRDVRLERHLAEDLDRSSQSLELMARESSPSQQASRREQAVLLADALKQLPEDYAEVIILRHFEGMRFPEIAQRMRRSIDSVEKLWVRALARLRGLLREST
jgi:RNA polymerase sigma-70 factor (ECF subfamily)